MKNIGNGKGPNVIHRRKDVGVDDQFLPSVCEGGKSGQKSDEQHDRRVSDVERWARGLTDSQYTSFPSNVLSKAGFYRSKIGNQPEWNDVRQFPDNSAARHRYTMSYLLRLEHELPDGASNWGIQDPVQSHAHCPQLWWKSCNRKIMNPTYRI